MPLWRHALKGASSLDFNLFDKDGFIRKAGGVPSGVNRRHVVAGRAIRSFEFAGGLEMTRLK
jgi:hypothetical protein